MSARREIGIFVEVFGQADEEYAGPASVIGYNEEDPFMVDVMTDEKPSRRITVDIKAVQKIPGTPVEVVPGKRLNRAAKRALKKGDYIKFRQLTGG